MKVQSRVSEYISENGIRNSFVAEKVGMSPVIVSRILSLKREMTADEFELFCKALKKQPGDFMSLEE